MTKRVMLALLTTLAVATACSSGGGNVTSPNSLNPTVAPSGAPAITPSPTAAGTTPTPTPVATASSVAATPTPVATASSSAVAATPTPTPAPTTSSSGTLATTCATASGSPSSMMYTLPGPAETIQLPNYPASPPYQITGSSQIPSQSPAGSVLTIEISQNSFNNGTFVTPSGKTVDFYATLEVSESTQFGGSNNTSLLIPVTIVSPCVVAGRTYTVDEASSGLTVYTETDTPTTSGSVTGHIEASLNPFPANTIANVTVSH